MTNDKYRSMCLLTICISSLEKCLLKFSAYFNWVICLLFLSSKSIFWKIELYQTCDLQIFSIILDVAFSFFIRMFFKTQKFLF